MNLMVTGALGHIGSRLIRAIPPGLCGRVSLIDNLSTQRYPSLFQLPEGVPFRFFEEDILTANLEERFEGMDVVVHLAALTNAEASVGIPEEVERVNVQGTERVAAACAAAGCKLVFLSTTSVYGIQEDEVDEDCPAEHLRPQSPYAESKLKTERFLQELGERNGLDFIICRFGTIFGVSPGMRFHTAVNKFCWQAVTGVPITVWRTALHQQRPYLDLGDAVEALTFIITRGLFDRNIYNVVTTNASVKHILDIIAAQVPDSAVQFVETRIMNQLSYRVSSARFRKLGFEFRGNLEQGIRETIELLRGARRRADRPSGQAVCSS